LIEQDRRQRRARQITTRGEQAGHLLDRRVHGRDGRASRTDRAIGCGDDGYQRAGRVSRRDDRGPVAADRGVDGSRRGTEHEKLRALTWTRVVLGARQTAGNVLGQPPERIINRIDERALGRPRIKAQLHPRASPAGGTRSTVGSPAPPPSTTCHPGGTETR
jgi:hypothetical protein